MKNKTGRIIMMVVLVALFGARVYNSLQQKKNREKQQQMIYDLSRQQAKERMEKQQQEKQKAMDEIMNDLNLDSLRNAMDSLGEKMKKDQAEFNRKLDSINNN